MHFAQMKRSELIKAVKILTKVNLTQEKETEELVEVVPKLIDAFTKLQSENEALINGAKFYVSEIEFYKKENAELHAQTDDLLEAYKNLADVCIEMKQATPENFSEEMNKMRERLDKKNEEINELKQIIEDQKKEAKVHTDELAQLFAEKCEEVAWFTEEVSKQNDILDNNAKNIDSMNVANQEFENDMNKITKQKDNLIEDHNLRIAQLVEENEDLEKQLQESWKEIQRMGNIICNKDYELQNLYDCYEPTVESTTAIGNDEQQSSSNMQSTSLATSAPNRKRRTVAAPRRGRSGKKTRQC